MSKKLSTGIVRVDDVWDDIEESLKRWKEEKRVGTVSYDVDCKAITFHYDSTTEQYRYWFHASRIRTAEQQMQWLNHLRHKDWFTKEVMNDFMDVLIYSGLLPEGLNT